MQAISTSHVLLGIIYTIAFFVIILFLDNFVKIANEFKAARLRLLLSLCNRIEPSEVIKFRTALSKTFEELSNFVEKSELGILRSRIENVKLQNKIKELEKNRQALIAELGGSSDFLDIEYSLWNNLILVVNFLISDRLRLIQCIDEIKTYQLFSSETDFGTDQLLNDLIDLKEQVVQLEGQKQKLSDKNILLIKEQSNLRNSYEQTIQDRDEEILELTKILEILKPQADLLNYTKEQLENLEQDFERQNREYVEKTNGIKSENYNLLVSNKQLEAQVERLQTNLAKQQALQSDLQQEIKKLKDYQEIADFQILDPDDFDNWEMDELEVENSYLLHQISRFLKRTHCCTEIDYWICHDYLSHVDYWREHLDYD